MLIFLAKIPIQDIDHILEQISHVTEFFNYIHGILTFLFGPQIALYIIIGLITGIPVILLLIFHII